ncbi:protein of unknown function [Shewanella benthica]|uniref:Uncharacterized protein n=1 Tax=Shewanella benthica TaxID=43661 RepID=A0A330M7G0_9GAMM|nr:protein of unknown function [Shewanella benthica]
MMNNKWHVGGLGYGASAVSGKLGVYAGYSHIL